MEDDKNNMEVVNDYGNVSSFSLTPRAATTGSLVQDQGQGLGGVFRNNSCSLEEESRRRSCAQQLKQTIINNTVVGTRTRNNNSTMSSFCSEVDGNDESYEESLEDGVVRLMKGSGFLAQVKGQIAKYISEISKQQINPVIMPERADKELLSQIYEYLEWVGMQSTGAVLLSETPVGLVIDVGGKPDVEPKLLTIFKGRSQYKDEESKFKKVEGTMTMDISSNDVYQDVGQSEQTILHEDNKILDETEVDGTPRKVMVENGNQSSTTMLVNKGVIGDLLTESPLSSPISSLINNMNKRSQNGARANVESFDDFLKAYVGNSSVEDVDEVEVGSSKPSEIDLKKDVENKTPPGSTSTTLAESTHKNVPVGKPDQGIFSGKSETSKWGMDNNNLMAFSSSTPIKTVGICEESSVRLNSSSTLEFTPTGQPSTPLKADGIFEDSSVRLNSSSKLEITPSGQDITFTVNSSNSGPERNLFSKKIHPQAQPNSDSDSSNCSSASMSIPPKDKEEEKVDIESPGCNIAKSSLVSLSPPFDEKSKSDKKKSSEVLKHEEQDVDISTSDAVSMDLELELDNDNTQDISLPSDAKGMSFCEHVVNIK